MPRMRGWFDDDTNPFIPSYVSHHAHNYLSASNAAISSGRSLDRHGQMLQKTAPTSMPSVGKKIWSPYTRQDLIHYRSRTKNLPSHLTAYRVDQYDHRPDSRRLKHQQRHWDRSYGTRKGPKGGYYSKPNEGNIRFHRAKRHHTGTAMVGSGRLLKVLGWGGIAYTAYYVYKNPSDRNIDLAIAMLIGGIKYTNPYGWIGPDNTEVHADELGRQRSLIGKTSPYAKVAVGAALSAHPILRHL